MKSFITLKTAALPATATKTTYQDHIRKEDTRPPWTPRWRPRFGQRRDGVHIPVYSWPPRHGISP